MTLFKDQYIMILVQLAITGFALYAVFRDTQIRKRERDSGVIGLNLAKPEISAK